MSGGWVQGGARVVLIVLNPLPHPSVIPQIHVVWTYCLHSEIMFVYSLQLLERSYSCGHTWLELQRWQGTARALGILIRKWSESEDSMQRQVQWGRLQHWEGAERLVKMRFMPTPQSTAGLSAHSFALHHQFSCGRVFIKPLLNLPLFFLGLSWDDFAGEDERWKHQGLSQNKKSKSWCLIIAPENYTI